MGAEAQRRPGQQRLQHGAAAVRPGSSADVRRHHPGARAGAGLTPAGHDPDGHAAPEPERRRVLQRPPAGAGRPGQGQGARGPDRSDHRAVRRGDPSRRHERAAGPPKDPRGTPAHQGPACAAGGGQQRPRGGQRHRSAAQRKHRRAGAHLRAGREPSGPVARGLPRPSLSAERRARRDPREAGRRHHRPEAAWTATTARFGPRLQALTPKVPQATPSK